VVAIYRIINLGKQILVVSMEWEKIFMVPPEFRDWDNSILNEEHLIK